VAAASAPLILAADEAGLFAVGIASGSCTSARLTRTGARCTFGDLSALADCLTSGGEALRAAGLDF
jgi:hypothetical protein